MFFPEAHAPHFAYVGDSLLGSRVNLGAGTKLSNLPITSEKDRLTGERATIKIRGSRHLFDTGLGKMGAILGDGVQIGCNAVTSPGTFVGPYSLVYPMTGLRAGFYPARSRIKSSNLIEILSLD